MTDKNLTSASAPSPPWPRSVRITAASLAGIAIAVVIAYLVATGHPEVAGVLLLAPAAAHIALRYPLAAMVIWLLLAPFAVETSGGGLRMVFWLVHRAAPLAAVVNVVLAAGLGARPRLPRLTWAEAAMAGYLFISQLSILYTSDSMIRPTFRLYDRVVVPMCLYLLVRFVQPDERHLRKLMPIVVFVLLSQTLIGVLQWTAPGVLPGAWLNRVGTRTNGSLSQPGVYGSTMLFAALLLLHLGISQRDQLAGRVKLWLVPVAFAMVFMTYSRASWLAGAIVVLGMFTIYPRYVTKLTIGLLAVIVALLLSGAIDAQVEQAQRRFLSESSEKSALSRLPVIAASLRMVQSKPVTGWGFDSFDEHSRQFQGAVGGLIVPEESHASHNLYLTLLAEQGLLGFVLYMGPCFYWLVRSRTAWRTMPIDGIVSRKLLVSLWLMLLSQVVVNNYANMRSEWGLGLWWVTLGLIASLVMRYQPVATASATRAEQDVDSATVGVGRP
jgi:O-antigen ligase